MVVKFPGATEGANTRSNAQQSHSQNPKLALLLVRGAVGLDTGSLIIPPSAPLSQLGVWRKSVVEWVGRVDDQLLLLTKYQNMSWHVHTEYTKIDIYNSVEHFMKSNSL